MVKIKTSCAVLASALSLLAAAGAANAGIMIGSNASAGEGNTNATFTGTLDYTPNTATTGTLTVVLTNTTAPALNARLTAFVFNIGSALSPSSLLLTQVGANLSNISGGSANPFGSSYVGGAGTGGQFEGGGSPNNGIAPGNSGTFTFRITTTSAPALTASDFLTGPYNHDFVVRFRGLADGSSSKIPATIVPAPGVGAMALMSVCAMARRRR
ncbi:MAG: hypothetical protein ACKVZJ_12540 [Phycisphaerales bacterium]